MLSCNYKPFYLIFELISGISIDMALRGKGRAGWLPSRATFSLTLYRPHMYECVVILSTDLVPEM